MTAAEEHDEAFLTGQEGQLLLDIARDTLQEWTIRRATPPLERYELPPNLLNKHAAFVTLRNQGELRGCVGYTANTEPLAAAVRHNTVNAASKDTRFPPVEASELPDIAIEISVLTPGDTPETPFKRVRDAGEIVIGRDGLYVAQTGSKGGLLLPQVAVEEDWDRDAFLSAVCRKAGYTPNAWRDPDTRIYRFSAQVFSET